MSADARDLCEAVKNGSTELFYPLLDLTPPLEFSYYRLKKMLWQMALPFIFEAAAIDDENICDCLTIIDYARIKNGYNEHIPIQQKLSRAAIFLFSPYLPKHP